MSAIFFGLTVFAAEYRFGSLEAGRAWFSGASLFVDTPEFLAEFGPDQPEVSLRYVVRNLGDRPIPIVGASGSCSCTVTDRLPAAIPARGMVEVTGKVRIEPSRRGDEIRGSIRIYVGHEVRSEIPLQYVLKPSANRLAEATNHAISSH